MQIRRPGPRASDVGRAIVLVRLAALAVLALFLALPAGLSGATKAMAAERAAKDKADQKTNLVGHGGPVRAIEISAGGTHALTGSFDYSMIYWDLSGAVPRIAKRFDDHDGAVNAVRFLPGDRLALSGGDDGIVRLWDLQTGDLVHAFKGHTAKIVDLDVTPDGRYAVSASWDRSARFWDLESKSAGLVLDSHKGPVNAVAFTQKEGGGTAFYTAGHDGSVRHWDMTTGELKRAVYRHGWGINCLEALPGADTLLFGSLNGAAGIIDAEAGEVSTVLNPHEGPVLAVAISAAHKLIATGGGDGTVNIWSMEDWGLKEQHQNPYGPVWAIGFTGDAKNIYYAGLDDFVTRWQVHPRQPFETVDGKFPRRFQARENMSLGELQFARKCSVCHTITPDGGNRAGPTLYGVFGRKAGTVPGYAYSPALLNSDIIWNEETIGLLFDHGPQHVTPGSKMPLQQIEDDTKRNALVSYLKSASTGSEQTDGAAGASATSKE